MGQAELIQRIYTPQEYVEMEAASDVRHEYFEGEVYAMAGASLSHNLLKGNMVAALRSVARGRGCRVYDENVKLAAPDDSFYTYPDIMLSCVPTDRGPQFVRQPVLIVEILSPSTAEFDRTGKFGRYQKLPSLRHYLLVSQAAWVVEWFRRDEAGQWIYTLLDEPTAVLILPDLGLSLPLAELYDDTDVAPLRLLPGS